MVALKSEIPSSALFLVPRQLLSPRDHILSYFFCSRLAYPRLGALYRIAGRASNSVVRKEKKANSPVRGGEPVKGGAPQALGPTSRLPFRGKGSSDPQEIAAVPLLPWERRLEKAVLSRLHRGRFPLPFFFFSSPISSSAYQNLDFIDYPTPPAITKAARPDPPPPYRQIRDRDPPQSKRNRIRKTRTNDVIQQQSIGGANAAPFAVEAGGQDLARRSGGYRQAYTDRQTTSDAVARGWRSGGVAAAPGPADFHRQTGRTSPRTGRPTACSWTCLCVWGRWVLLI
jgi:hypothetical protein